MDNTTNELRSSLESLRPSLEAYFIEHYTNLITRLLGDNGRFTSRELYSYDINFICSMAKDADDTKANGPQVIDLDRIKSYASTYATNLINTYIEKIDSKLGSLESAKVISGNQYFEFFVEGIKDGKNVSIKQSMRQNWSANGRPFDQFPALCYIDGKRIKASEFKKLFA